MTAWILCAIGMHAWWYDVPGVDGAKPLWMTARDARLVRICSTCPAKQRSVGGRWISAR